MRDAFKVYLAAVPFSVYLLGAEYLTRSESPKHLVVRFAENYIFTLLLAAFFGYSVKQAHSRLGVDPECAMERVACYGIFYFLPVIGFLGNAKRLLPELLSTTLHIFITYLGVHTLFDVLLCVLDAHKRRAVVVAVGIQEHKDDVPWTEQSATRACVVCKEKERCVLFEPCRHLAVCRGCDVSRQMMNGKCGYCAAHVVRSVVCQFP
jgi:hypothetical protein